MEFRNLVNTRILASTDIVSFKFGNNPETIAAWRFTRLIQGGTELKAGRGWESIGPLAK